MAVQTAIAFATFLLEHEHFVALYEGFEYFAFHFGTLYGGCAYLHGTVGVYEKHLVEAYCLTLLYLVAEMVYIQILAFFGFELLTFDFYNSVHANSLCIKCFRWAVASRATLMEPWRYKSGANLRFFYHSAKAFRKNFANFASLFNFVWPELSIYV